MKVISDDAGDEAVLAVVREWVGLMAADDYEAAFAFLHPRHATSQWPVSGADLRDAVTRYEAGQPLRGGPSQVTPAETAGGPLEPLEEISRDDDGTLRSIDYALPVNGEWSELVEFQRFRAGLGIEAPPPER